MYLIFDTETTGLPKRWDAPITETDNWPRCIQIAWQLHDEWGNLIESRDYLVKPEGFDIPYDAERIHGISTALADQQGEPLDFVLEEFNQALKKSKFIVGQNVGFDVNIMGCEFSEMRWNRQWQKCLFWIRVQRSQQICVKSREVEEENLNFQHLQNYTSTYLEKDLVRRIMQRRMLKQQHGVF